ncbi:MAG: OmpA family protein [Pedobacter sp.]|nr:MAG: OmpA family protein [Pedobacter sp.]
MAHLEVEPKPARPWWIWALIVILLIVLATLLLKKCGPETTGTKGDSTAMDSSGVIAATVPDWSAIDFNSATTTDADISDNEIETRTNENYTIYTLGENILFPTDGNELSLTGQGKLKTISDVLNKRFAGATIGIFGSTDSTGPADENKELGSERAESVRNWLVGSGNISEETISVRSLGETEPVATNQTTAGRQQNRNVSIVVFPKQ